MNSTFFDTHTHLTDADRDPAAYYARAAENGVTRLLFCSSGWNDALRCADFAASNANIYFAAGVHPHEAQEMTESVSDYRSFAEKTRLAAVGEIGLDYFYDISPRETQLRVFEEFLKLALELNLPAVIHCRGKDGCDDAYRDCFGRLRVFSENGGRFVLHAFAGTPEWLEKFIGIGAWFGVGGMLTFRRADNIRPVVSAMPRDRVMLETDSPYLAPVPHRGETNHPALLPCTAQVLAQLYGMTMDELAALTTDNALRFLNIPREARS